MRRALRERNHSPTPGKETPSKSPSAPPSEVLPPSLDGNREFAFIATKQPPVAGKNGGCWRVSAQVKVSRKVTFKHRFSIVFNLDDDANDRDAESFEQLRGSLIEFFHRATAAPKTSLFLESNRDFVGARSVKLIGRKVKKAKSSWLFLCRAEANCDYGTYSRNTHYTFHSEADAARTSAAALLTEIRNTWAHATRSKANDDFSICCAENSNNNDPHSTPAKQNNNRGVGARTLNYIRDVYGATSNVDDIVGRRDGHV
mmetsp:Transcript_11944/g.16160  ORF Transcript_11944/g.16160 Transcript_11944/m.16160 type:complete len:258 (-) Transcript_11944:346-1119(-)